MNATGQSAAPTRGRIESNMSEDAMVDKNEPM